MTAEPVEGYNVADVTRVSERSAERRRAIIASAVGNFLELFDFAIYGFLAIPLGANFFPSNDPLISLLSSFATFGVGFIMRPVGAVVIGIYGDRKGRKAALSLTIVMMAAATGVVGLFALLFEHRRRCANSACSLPNGSGICDRRRMGRRGRLFGGAFSRQTKRFG
jgi:MFS family permease